MACIDHQWGVLRCAGCNFLGECQSCTTMAKTTLHITNGKNETSNLIWPPPGCLAKNARNRYSKPVGAVARVKNELISKMSRAAELAPLDRLQDMALTRSTTRNRAMDGIWYASFAMIDAVRWVGRVSCSPHAISEVGDRCDQGM